MNNYLKRFTSLAILALVAAILSACASSPNTGEPSFEVQLITRSLQIVQGSSTDFQVRLNRDRFTDPITVTASELPAGVTAGAVTTTGSTATLRFLAADDAAQGETKSVTIFATAGGKTSEAVTTTLSVRGAPGALDTTFSGGRVTVPAASEFDAALAPDGSIVLVGTEATSTTTVLMRLTADGKPDPTFPTRSFNLAPGIEVIGGVAVQPDGKIVVGARLDSAPPSTNFIGVARFTSQGELDPSFSGDGIATLAVSAPVVRAVALAPDGKIVLVGSMSNGSGRKVLVTRFSLDGQPDLGSSGFITDSFDSFGTSEDEANAVVVAPDGSIIVAGVSQGSNKERFVLARYLSSGLLDPSFGTAGHVIPKFAGISNGSRGHAVILQQNGNIIAAGSGRRLGDPPLSTVVTRLLPNGSPDPSFSDDGALVLSDGSASSLLLELNGRILLGGTASAGENDFALQRLEANGKLDLGFGGGSQTTDFGGTNDRVFTLLRSSNGRLVLAGASNNNIALARYWP